MSDWAQDKAREWIEARGGLVVSDDYCIDSLAALLVEVSESAHDDICARLAKTERTTALAEVRRVVEQKWMVYSNRPGYTAAEDACDEILARLEKL